MRKSPYHSVLVGNPSSTKACSNLAACSHLSTVSFAMHTLTVDPITLLGLWWALLTCLRWCQVIPPLRLPFFFAMRHAICCHVLSTPSSRGSQSSEQQPLNLTFGKLSQATAQLKAVSLGRGVVCLFVCFFDDGGKQHWWSLTYNNHVSFKSCERRREAPCPFTTTMSGICYLCVLGGARLAFLSTLAAMEDKQKW